jgi:hypothetical protein
MVNASLIRGIIEGVISPGLTDRSVEHFQTTDEVLGQHMSWHPHELVLGILVK